MNNTPPHLSRRAALKLIVALAIYITSLIASNTLSLKLMPFWFDSHLSVTVFFFPFVFLMTDIVGEVYGKPYARAFVLAGFVSTLLFILWSAIAVVAPWSGDSLWAKEGYDIIFKSSIRISLASLLAFAIGEYQDVFVFFFVRQRIGARLFWLRSALSNLWSQLLDSSIFMVVAFAGIYSPRTIGIVIVTWTAYKVAVGLLYTPLSYLGIRLIRADDAPAA